MFGKQKVAMIVAEFFGTAVLASVALAMIERTSFPFFLAAAMAAVYGACWFMFSDSSGGHFNPVITVGAWTLRKIQTTQAVVFLAAQGLGGLAAWRVNQYLQGSQLPNLVVKQFDWHILIAEGIGALIFGMGVAAALYNTWDDLKRSITVGGSLFVGVLAASFASSGLLNPAVAIGVHSLSWSYGIGPLVGAVIGMNLYVWLFATPSKASARARVATPSTTRVAATSRAKKPAAKRRPVAKKPAARRSTARTRR